MNFAFHRGLGRRAGIGHLFMVSFGTLVLSTGCPPTVDMTNLPPTASDQEVSTGVGAGVDVTLDGSDGNGDDLTFRIESLTTNGTLWDSGGNAIDVVPKTLDDDGVRYIPDDGFTGEDSFTFTVNDGLVDSNEATVSITVGDVITRTFDVDTTVTALDIPAGTANRVTNSAEIHVTGNAVIDGTLLADQGRITLIVDGDLTVNGAIQAHGDSPEDDAGDQPLNEQAAAVLIVVGNGTVTFGPESALSSTGPVAVTDDPSLLNQTPGNFFEEVENIVDDDLPTLVPLPPDNPVFEGDPDGGNMKQRLPVVAQGAVGGPVNLMGVWPPPGAPPVPGDKPVIIFRFFGMRPLNIGNYTLNAPAAPDGQSSDENDPNSPLNPRNGKNGMRVNIWNNGGPINVTGTVVINLADGGAGGNAIKVCANATGADGGNSGNFRMTASGGINMDNGTLTINPGRAGAGGMATVNAGAAGAAGCPGAMGDGGTATGGNGGHNRKRLLVRGNVTSLQNLFIGTLAGGDGGAAMCTVCPGGNGIACCDGGEGGDATARGGVGGDASLNVTAALVNTGSVNGGVGGSATANGARGGDGGDCKFGDGGDGGMGGDATATGGAGGSATATKAGLALGGNGGNGGNATSVAGQGGDGGDAGLGTPGSGGLGGNATATAGAGGAGSMPGMMGTASPPTSGLIGNDGAQLSVTLFCLNLPDFFPVPVDMRLDPGTFSGPVTLVDDSRPVGSVDLALMDTPSDNYQSVSAPVAYVGIGNGALDINLTTLQVEGGMPGSIGGVQLVPMQAFNIGPTSPLLVQSINAAGEVVDQREVPQLPFNQQDSPDAQAVDVPLTVDETVVVIRIVAPDDTFVAFFRIYIVDP